MSLLLTDSGERALQEVMAQGAGVECISLMAELGGLQSLLRELSGR